MKTQSLDIVYNPGAFAWLIDFFTKPQQTIGSNLRSAARRKYQAIKTATKNELIKNWEEIVAGDLVRKSCSHFYSIFLIDLLWCLCQAASLNLTIG